MQKIAGLLGFWVVADGIGYFLPAQAQFWVTSIAAVVVVAGLGSIVLSIPFGGDGFDHLIASFMLAAPGAVLMEFSGVKAPNPVDYCIAHTTAAHACGFGEMLVIMVLDLIIVAIGMAIVAIPAVPIMWKIHKDAAKADTSQK